MKFLYLDMDGVVADFDAYAHTVLGHKSDDGRWHKDKWARLRDNPRMYRDLPETPEATRLVDFCRSFADRHGYDLLFLTAVPKNNDIHWAFYDKVIWAQTRYPDIPVMFGPYSHDKQVHCTPGDILIDDRTSNIEQWIAAGGIGILHRDIRSTLEQLSAIHEKDRSKWNI